MTKIFTKLLSLIAIASILATSCTADRDINFGTNALDETSVLVTLQMPATSAEPSSPSTYSISGIDENYVEDIDVLAFKLNSTSGKWEYAYKAIGTITSESGNSNSKKTFDVTLLKKNYKQKFVILANAREDIDALGTIAKNADKDLLLARLVRTNDGEWKANSTSDFTPIPMWGEIEATIGNGPNNLSTFMLRSVARVDVKLSDEVIDAANFTLEEIHIYNSKKQGNIVPHKDNLESLSKVKNATVPASASNNETIAYTTPPFENTIYMFEAEAVAQNKASDATCVVVGGKYDGGAITYYRVDFFKSDKKTYKDILRNHNYTINIKEVKGDGYATPEDAFNSTTLNILVDVVEWSAENINLTVDGQHYLSILPKMVYEFTREGGTQYVYIKTNVTEGFKITAINNADGTPIVMPGKWMFTIPAINSATGKNETETKVSIFTSNNETNKKREGYIIVKAGRVEAKIVVKQSVIGKIDVVLFDNNDDVILGDLVFASHAGVLSPTTSTQALKVVWAPASEEVVVSNASGGNFTGTGLPNGNITNGTGTHTYNITASAFTPAELATNPFFSKKSTVDFSIHDGDASVNRLINIHHINYNMIINNLKNYYILDGQPKSINVKTNFDWEITDVQDPSGIFATKPAIGTTGIADISAGNDVSFTMSHANSTNVGKSATIIFKNPLDGHTWPVVINATNSKYVGMFGGDLKKGSDGVWQFESGLYIETTDTSTGINWATISTSIGIKNPWDGKQNTLSLRNLSLSMYPAAVECFQKNNNWSTITSTTDANYVWYLPSRNELLAAWVTNNSEIKYKLSNAGYWTSMENSIGNSYTQGFDFGVTDVTLKTSLAYVRCVRE